MKISSVAIFYIFLKIICTVDSSKILMVFPTAMRSHFFLGNALGKALANVGHEITMVSAYEDKIPPKHGKYSTILLTGMEHALDNKNVPTWKEYGELHPVHTDIVMKYIGHLLTNFTLNHPNFQKLLHGNKTFDVIILQQFCNDALKVLSCHFKIPLISFSTLTATVWINPFAGNPSPPSYVPDMFLSYTSNMNLWQRIKNSLLILIKNINNKFSYLPKQGDIIKNHFPKCYPMFDKILYNVSLTMVNSHESISTAVPFVPSMIQIGGFHLSPPKKLPDELQKFMDEAKEGVVYFSLGTSVLSSNIGSNTKRVILQVLGKLKQRVLLKWDDDIEEKPDNVKIQKVFPQQDILAHPNLKLFITHGGLLSNIETVHYAVPVLFLPVFGDQKLNAAKAEHDGYGLTIWLQNVEEENLTEALEKLLNDSKYRENIKRRSSLLRDRPVKPLDLAIYWTEFIIKHKGAPHLRVTALDLEWYQYLILDVIAIVFIGTFSLLVCLYYIIKTIFKKTIHSKSIKIE